MRFPSFGQFALEGTRRAQYAGSWYEADPAKLRAQLGQFLKKADPIVDQGSLTCIAANNPTLAKPILAIVAPHAGYVFSGQAAAYAYKSVQGQGIKRIFLLGPSHHIGFHGAALPLALAFATPLGDLEVDKDAVAELANYPMFSKLPEVHKVEHSLEMQLPLIKVAFGNVKIVPIVVGALADETEIRLLAEILKGYIGKGDLVVVSSDFTHYGPRYSFSPFKDHIREKIRKLDGRAFSLLSSRNLEGFIKFEDETKDTICGYYPCAVLAALLPPESKGALLKYYTSQDAAPGSEDVENSVSYMAIAFSGGDWPQQPGKKEAADTIHLSSGDKSALLKLARGTLEAYVVHGKTPTPQELGVAVSPAMRKELGAFVTLNTISKDPKPDAPRHGDELRGCIGYIWPLKPIYQAVIDNAVSAASKDYRFPPVEADELNHIKVEISVLTPPRRVNSYKDIVIGRDGMVLMKDGKQSVFLPFVATEYGWDLPQTLTQLSLKAGLKPDDWKEGAKYDVFQAEVFKE